MYCGSLVLHSTNGRRAEHNRSKFHEGIFIFNAHHCTGDVIRRSSYLGKRNELKTNKDRPAVERRGRERYIFKLPRIGFHGGIFDHNEATPFEFQNT